jgi:hypothetical protein
MASTINFDEIRHALRDAKREIKSAEQSLATGTLVTFNVVQARQTVRDAEAAVRNLVTLLNSSPGRGIDFGLIRTIRAAEIRLSQAREALKRINRNQPTKNG